jgi:lipopolysaccharide heptosyltransferase I
VTATRFLIVRLGALGDIVHAIPVAAALRRAHPSARIEWLVSAKHQEILDLVPVIDRRWVVNDRGSARGGQSLPGAIAALRREHYDVAIDLQGLIKSALIARASGAAAVLGFARRHLREPLARLFYTQAHDPGGGSMFDSQPRHVVFLNLALLGAIGINAGAPEFPLAPVASDVARRMTDEAGGSFALLNPGAAWPNKRWPPDRLAAVARTLAGRHGLRSVVLWGPGEHALAETVVAAAGGAAIISPATSIADVVALARAAAVMVSGDTGPTHIAAAVGTPLVGIFGPTRPERNGPWRGDDVTVSRAEICQCHHLRRCKRPSMCLMDIEVEEVVAAVERRLAAEPSRV